MKAERAANDGLFFGIVRFPLALFGVSVALLATQAGCSTQGGCATSRVWTKTIFMPAYPTTMRLFESEHPADFVVEYEEENVQHGGSQWRAYFLHANVTNIVQRRCPQFVEPAQIRELKPIPIFNRASIRTNPPPANGFFALTPRERLEFELYRNGCKQCRYTLPVYEKLTNPVGRVLLTPFAAALDATVGFLLGMGGGQIKNGE